MSAAYILDNLRIRIHELHGVNAPSPSPKESGFTEGRDYPVLGAIEHSPDGELWLIVPNDQNMIYRISNRHCRYVVPGSTERPGFISPELWADMQKAGKD